MPGGVPLWKDSLNAVQNWNRPESPKRQDKHAPEEVPRLRPRPQRSHSAFGSRPEGIQRNSCLSINRPNDGRMPRLRDRSHSGSEARRARCSLQHAVANPGKRPKLRTGLSRATCPQTHSWSSNPLSALFYCRARTLRTLFSQSSLARATNQCVTFGVFPSSDKFAAEPCTHSCSRDAFSASTAAS
jgi:hypothetical protein